MIANPPLACWSPEDLLWAYDQTQADPQHDPAWRAEIEAEFARHRGVSIAGLLDSAEA